MCRIPKHLFLIIIVLFSFLINLHHVISDRSSELFYPYGIEFGDAILSNVDNESSPEIILSHKFPYFDNLYDSLFVNTNGVISFNHPIDYKLEAFPLGDRKSIIAPFWTDIDTTHSDFGIFYRESQNSDLLEQLSKEIKKFVDQVKFQATWSFIATWDNVTFYGGGPNIAMNTFQAVLITNGHFSFVIFNYGKIIWTTGLNNQSADDNNYGFGGISALAGFNAGDGYRYYLIPGSLNPSIVHIDNTSNIGKPGRWIFRLDDKHVGSEGYSTQEVNCSKPDPPLDGLVRVKSVSLGMIIEYDCNEGYYLDGVKKRTCLHTGLWSAESPTCLAKTPIISVGFLAGVLGGIGATFILIGFVSFCYRLNINKEINTLELDGKPLVNFKKKEDSPSSVSNRS